MDRLPPAASRRSRPLRVARSTADPRPSDSAIVGRGFPSLFRGVRGGAACGALRGVKSASMLYLQELSARRRGYLRPWSCDWRSRRAKTQSRRAISTRGKRAARFFLGVMPHWATRHMLSKRFTSTLHREAPCSSGGAPRVCARRAPRLSLAVRLAGLSLPA